MGGLRKLIKRRIPESWEYALRKHKVYAKYINFVYFSLPEYMRGTSVYNGKLGWQIGADRIIFILSNWNIENCILGMYVEEIGNNDLWRQIKRDIRLFEDSCR